MRKIIEMIAGEKIDLLPFGIDLTTHQIDKVYTIYDENRMWTWCKFDPYTGKPVTFTNLEELPLRHREGIFLEDFVHDWNIRRGDLFDYYSRVTSKGDTVQILIEFSTKE